MKNLIGMKFGKLTVMKLDPEEEYFIGRHGYKRRKIKWICQCDCGSFTHTFAQGLQGGQTTQCKACGYYRQKTIEQMIRQVVHNAKYRSKQKNISFSLTVKYLQELFDKQNGKCVLSGEPIGFANTNKENKKGKTTASLDRIDSSKGYDNNNVQWVHKRVNSMKNDMLENEFNEWCKKIVDRMSS